MWGKIEIGGECGARERWMGVGRERGGQCGARERGMSVGERERGGECWARERELATERGECEMWLGERGGECLEGDGCVEKEKERMSIGRLCGE